MSCCLILWDLAQFYENIDRRRLARRSQEVGFPMAIWAPAIQMYGETRIVTFNQLASPTGHSTSGLPAGCGFATSKVQVYIMSPIDDMLASWGSQGLTAQLNVYIDDYGLAVVQTVMRHCASRRQWQHHRCRMWCNWSLIARPLMQRLKLLQHHTVWQQVGSWRRGCIASWAAREAAMDMAWH